MVNYNQPKIKEISKNVRKSLGLSTDQQNLLNKIRYVERKAKEGKFHSIKYETFEDINLMISGRTGLSSDDIELAIMNKDWNFIKKVKRNIQRFAHPAYKGD